MKSIAVIGCGKAAEGKEGWAIGHQHAIGYAETSHEHKLLGVDLSPDNLKAFGEKFEVPQDQLFASTDALYAAGVPDVVSICTWPALHHPMVMEALEKGVKGIVCEKPFTLDVGQQREIEQKAQDVGATVLVAHQRRRGRAFKALKDVALNGKLGENLRILAQVSDGWDILSWSSHWFDMANFFFDSPPEWVLAGMDIGETRRYQQAVEDASVIYAEYPDFCSAVFVTGPGRGFNVRVTGSRGMAFLDGDNICCLTVDGAETVPVPEGRGDFGNMLQELLDALEGGPEPLCSIRYSAMGTEMAYAAHESARIGKKVHLPLQTLYAPLEVAQHPIRSGLSGRKVLLYADSHFGSGGREGIADALTELTGHAPRVMDAEASGLTPDDLLGVDAVAIYHTQKDASDETKAVLTDWVDEGRPLLILHAGLGAWPEWKEYAEWCGKVWEWGVSVHPHEAAPLKVSDGDPLAFGWSEAWLPRDEVFVKLKDTAPITVGMTTEISIGTFEVAWRNEDRPNVGAWMPGHRRDSWQVPAMREGMARTLLSLGIHKAGV